MRVLVVALCGITRWTTRGVSVATLQPGPLTPTFFSPTDIDVPGLYVRHHTKQLDDDPGLAYSGLRLTLRICQDSSFLDQNPGVTMTLSDTGQRKELSIVGWALPSRTSADTVVSRSGCLWSEQILVPSFRVSTPHWSISPIRLA